MARLDILLSGYDITDEVINRSSSSSLKLDHDTIRGTADIEIWTGAGGTGTQLALTTDYTVAGEDTRLSTAVGGGISVYTTLAIVNGAYHSTPLYVSYKTIGDYASASSGRLIGIGLKEITGAYTVTASDRTIIVNTSSAVTITIPDGLMQGFDLCISRTLASTQAITVAMSGSETIEGASSLITHGAFSASTLNDAEVVLKKKTDTAWKFVSGVISGSAASGKWYRYPDGNQRTRGSISPASNDNSGTTYTFPIAYKTGEIPNVWTNAIGILSSGAGSSYVSEHVDANATTVKVKVLGHASSSISNAINIPIEVLSEGAWK